MSSKKIFLGVELSSSKKVNALTFTTLILLIFSLISAYYVFNKSNNIYSPMYVDSSSYGVIFNIDHALYRTDRDGTLIEGLSFKTLGLKEVADVKFFNGGLLVLQGNGKVKRCEIPLGSCRNFASAPSYRADIYMRIIPSKNEQYFYVIQTNKSKIDKFDKEGKHLYRLHTQQKNVKYPRGGIALSNDTLILADTGHQRVIALQDKGENNATVIWSFSTKNLPFKSSYSRVLDVKLDTANNIWITNTNKSYEKAHTFSLAAENIKEILENSSVLPKKSIKVHTNKANHLQSKLLQYPSSITAHRNGVLIADENTFKLLYVDETSIPTQFGDGYIQTKLKKLYNQKTFYKDVLNILIGLFGLAILLAIIAAILEMPISAKKILEESKEIKYNDEPTIINDKKIEPNDVGVIWLLPNKKILQQIQWLKYLFIIISLYITYISFAHIKDIYDFKNTLPLFSLGFLYFIYTNLNFNHYALGVDETHMYIQTGKDKKARAPFKEVLYSTEALIENPPYTRIAINDITMPLFHNNDNMYKNYFLYDQEQFNYYIKPKLKNAQQVSWNTMLEKQIKSIEVSTWFIIFLPLLLLTIQFFSSSI